MRRTSLGVLVTLLVLTLGCSLTPRSSTPVEMGIKIVGTTSSIGQAEHTAYQRYSYALTLFNDTTEGIYVAWVEPLLISGFRAALIPAAETRIQVQQSIAPGAFLEIRGDLTFDPAGQSKEDILAWEPFVTGWNVSTELVLRTATLSDNAQGRIIGYVRAVEEKSGKRYLSLDEMEWLTGDEASYAMRADGECFGPLSECQPPNPFYIRNTSQEMRRIEVTPNAEIIMNTYSHALDGTYQSNEPIAWDTFAALFAPQATTHLSQVPYWLHLQDGKVIRIEEQYLP